MAEHKSSSCRAVRDRVAEKRRQFKDGGVSQCWHCSRQLVRIKGGFLYALVEDPIGNRMRVHKDCVRLAVGDGIKEVIAQQA